MSEPSPLALATAAPSHATPDAVTRTLPSRKDIKQKIANEHEAAAPAAPKSSQDSHAKPKPAGVTDFGGRLY